MPVIMKKRNPILLYNFIKHYKNLTDLREKKVRQMNKINFLNMYRKYEINGSYTDIMIF